MNQRRFFTVPILIALAALFILSGPAPVKADSDQGYLGVYPQTIDKDLKEAFKLNSDHGVIIKGVENDSPADKAGIKQGDILLEYNGQDLASADDLVRLVHNDKPGQKVDLVVLHKGKEKNVSLELGDANQYADNDMRSFFGPGGHMAPGVHSFSKTWSSDNSSLTDTYIGVELSSLSEQLGQYFGVDNGDGALVTTVMDDSPAQKSGIKAGDVIVDIDGSQIDSPSDVQQIVRKANKGDELAVTVLRDKSRQKIDIEVAENENMSFMNPDQFNWNDNNFPFFAPQMNGLFRGNFDSNTQNDNQSLRKEIEALKKEVQDLKDQVGK